jgi:S1-C subfamily serine protease
MRQRAVFLSLFLLLGSFTAAWAKNNNIEFLDKKLLKELNHSIYEVVTPKLESSKIQYDRPLPYDQLSFKERNEKYNSIGTAFFINDKELMTAEHVFGLTSFSLHKDFFIRDAQGKVYPIATIRKYSTVRDMAIFDLQEYPEDAVPLTFSRHLEVGDTVFSAGNALGEGISYRAGQVASFTDEEEYGKWKNIRFSSPASPGNSGGPLLNLQGEVVGVIVRKTQGENYNIAVPISEADNLTDKAEFHFRNVTVEIDGTNETVVRDWSFSLPLPAPVAEVAEKAQNNLDAFYKQLSDELTEQVKENNFPLGKRFRAYLRNQPVIQGIASLVPDVDFKKWSAPSYTLKKIPLSAEQNVYRGGSPHFDLQAVIEKTPDMPLKTFLSSPKTVLDTLLKAVPYYRYFGSEKIRIISLGEPEQTEVWQDKLGRKWTSSLWYSDHNDYFVTSHCLPHPKGALCIFDDNYTAALKINYFKRIKEGCDEITVGYDGDLTSWAEYLALGDEQLPAFFKKAKIEQQGDHLKLRLQDFQFDFTNPKITSKSDLHLHLGYANDKRLAEDLVLLELFPQKGSPAHYQIRPWWQPSPFSQDSYSPDWEEMMRSEGEYSGKVIDKGELRIIQKTAPQTKKTVTAFDGEKIDKVFTVGCVYKTAVKGKEDMEEDCARFFQSIEFF